MRCGILIVGSLLWDDGVTKRRAEWRTNRLDIGERQPVRVPIYYGRKSRSRGNTYTMTFGVGESSGQGVLVPCVREVDSVDDLVSEAEALWQAEDANAEAGKLHKSWGCVGAQFGQTERHTKLSADWSRHYRKINAQPVSIVNADGLLDIDWPNGLDGLPANFDVVLATATKPEVRRPTVRAVSNAWTEQCDGNEDYFFRNVAHGIRTADDLAIWQCIEERSPPWITEGSYKVPIGILRAEAAANPTT